jgi:hypothetical protein
LVVHIHLVYFVTILDEVVWSCSNLGNVIYCGYVKLLHEIDEDKDSIRIYCIEHESDAEVEILGTGEEFEESQLTIL